MKGAPQEKVTVTRQVSYVDLDLGTGEGVAEFRKRVNSAAVASCNELKTVARLHTSEPPATGRDCVSEAIDGAKGQVEAAIAAGEKSHHEKNQ
jgi:UrcA family protein